VSIPRTFKPVLLAALGTLGLSAAHLAAGADWPMWGGTPSRNMVSDAVGLPRSWDVETGRNVLWRADLGSQTYGNPVVADGKVFVGTNNRRPRDPAVEGDRGILMAFRAADGKFLWQAVTDKLSSDRDWPLVGICSSPLVLGQRLYYQTNRAELVALDTEGFLDGENDGPVQDEARTGPADADVLWRLDMAKELGVVPRFQSAGSPTGYGDLLFLNTTNGNSGSGKVPAPKAPSFLAAERATGKVAWSDASPGEGILNGQWSSPAVGVAGGVTQAVFGGGDGWLYGFEAATGKPLWRFDANALLPKEAAERGRGFFVASPVIHGDRVYVGLGQDPQEGAMPGAFWAIDATKRGDLTKTGAVWTYTHLSRTLSTAAVSGGLVYVADWSGFLHCLDATTGQALWNYDAMAPIWSSPLVADGRVYLATEDGEVLIFKAGRQRELLGKVAMEDAVYSTPVPAGRVLYVATNRELFALAEPAAP
jgi:outer membrane protein assembly factor BamB